MSTTESHKSLVKKQFTSILVSYKTKKRALRPFELNNEREVIN